MKHTLVLSFIALALALICFGGIFFFSSASHEKAAMQYKAESDSLGRVADSLSKRVDSLSAKILVLKERDSVLQLVLNKEDVRLDSLFLETRTRVWQVRNLRNDSLVGFVNSHAIVFPADGTRHAQGLSH